MTLEVGFRLGPYQLLEPIGVGGMGEVWKARDTKLDRDVALKVLSHALADDVNTLGRFEREAKAVALLSHPNILAIHDFGRIGGLAFAVMELLEGVTLRALLKTGPVPARRAVELGVQIADGLAAAHLQGIVHRDLKPENLFVTTEGRIKILDFGLARRTVPGTGADDPSPSAERLTNPGVVMGTVGYMAPEQVRGEPAGPVSDIFTLGAVLYEMLAGHRAFVQGTAVETMTAILREEPVPLRVAAPRTSMALRQIVERCLAKDADERYASARDLAHDLRDLLDRSSEWIATPREDASPPSSPSSRRPTRPVWIAGLAGALAILTFLAFPAFLAMRERADALPSFRQLTFLRGHVDAARFGPDGRTVVFSAAWGGAPPELFSGTIDGPEPRPLGFTAARLAGVSSAGEVALLLPSGESSSLVRAPLAGGAARQVAPQADGADWSPGGAALAIVASGDRKSWLEYPAGSRILEAQADGRFAGNPRVSPSGDTVAVVEWVGRATTEASVVLVDAAGGKRTLLRGLAGVRGLAWSPSGRELFFAAAEPGGGTSLRAVTPYGRERLVARFDGIVTLHDASPEGRWLITRDASGSEARGRLTGDDGERDLSWLGGTTVADLSADGTAVVLNERARGGKTAGAVFLLRQGAPAPIRLGEGEGLALSLDGRSVLARAPGQPLRLVLFPSGSGEPRDVPVSGLEEVASAWFFPDGQRLLLLAREPGKAWRPWVAALGGGAPRPIGPEGTSCTADSKPIAADGRVLLADTKGGLILLSPDGAAPRPLAALPKGPWRTAWTGDGALLVSRPDDLPAAVSRLDIPSGALRPLFVAGPPDAAGVERRLRLHLAADGAAWAYSYRRVLSDLVLVDGLK